MENIRDTVKITDIIEWDKSNWAKALPFWKHHLRNENKTNETKLLKDQKVLELGGRCGGLSLWAASLGANVTCSDLENPEKIASPIHNKYPELQKLIKYESVNALDIHYENYFDVICFKSVLGGVASLHENARREMLVQIHKALRNGGQLLFAENLTATNLHMWARKMFRKYEASWSYQYFDDLRKLCSEYFDQKYCTVGFAGTLGLNETMKVFLGHIDTALFDWSLPERWRYIFIDFCMKK
ncbi:MAG: class I SAM-dependent methyltransferase [Planctomycetaceae bacterium]|jgi:2-polyprenyl-3-methyl-5-hydroxy-6-metoxy-1,4-benzoquinol methylase|nr:class I SAM-dependent methyltransferase [Planctomycetaceae bacterium]